MITWDEPKRRENLRKHGIDLADCEVLFDAPLATTEDDREAYGEQRLQSLGLFWGLGSSGTENRVKAPCHGAGDTIFGSVRIIFIHETMGLAYNMIA